MTADDLRLQSALASLERNRMAIRARFAPARSRSDGAQGSAFPRSATFRWLLAAGRNRRLLGALAQILLGKSALGRALAALIAGMR